MRAISIFLIAGIVGLCSLWLSNVGQPWWWPGLITAVGVIAVISGLRFGGEDALFKHWAEELDELLFATPRRAVITVVALCVLLAISATGAWVTRPKPAPNVPSPNYMTVSVFHQVRQEGRFLAGADFIMHDERTGATSHTILDGRGGARFNDVLTPTSIEFQVNEQRGTELWMWSPSSRRAIPNLPYILDVNVDAEGAWSAAQSVQIQQHFDSVRGVQTPAGEQIGDPTLRTSNAPWGVPNAPLVINRYAYILGFSPDRRVPLWAAYAVAVVDDAGRLPRRFEVDPSVPASLQATDADYARSGYDRGHLISPSDVRFRGELAAVETGYFTALTPQTRRLNVQAWARLEQETRRLSQRLGHPVYVVTGPLFEGERRIIGESAIPVPSHFFRIITWEDEGRFQWAAYLMRNSDEDLPRNLREAEVPIGRIEAMSELHVLPLLAPQYEERMRSEVRGLPD